MPTSPSGIPYPSGSAAPAAAADMMAMAEFLDGHTVLTATDESNRDALWGDLPAPVLVASKARPAVWLKVSDTSTSADWRTVFEDTGWLTSGITASSGFDLSGIGLRRKNGRVDIVFTATRTGADIASNSSGNIANVAVAQIDSSTFYPYTSAGLSVASTGQYVGVYAYPSGALTLGHMLPSVTWSTGTTINFSGSFLAGDA